jgi:hypothetical protein
MIWRMSLRRKPGEPPLSLPKIPYVADWQQFPFGVSLRQSRSMVTALIALLSGVRDIVRRRTDLEAELLALRHQVLVLQRQHGRRRAQLRPADRLYWVVLSRLWPRWRDALLLVKPETVIAWQRRGFRWYWCWKSQRRASGRPAVPGAVVELITAMHTANPTWGAPRIHGELRAKVRGLTTAHVADPICRGDT